MYNLYIYSLNIYLYVYIYMFTCMHACVIFPLQAPGRTQDGFRDQNASPRVQALPS